MTEPRINDIQHYLGVETVHHWRDGLINRREMLRQLIGICGTTAGAAALLAACSSSDTTKASPTSAAPETAPAPNTTTAPGTTAAPSSAVIASTSTAAASTAPASSAAPPTTVAVAGGAPLAVAADDPSLTGSDITFAGPSGQLLGYLAKPKTPPPGTPGVLVIHEIFGLTDHIKDVTRRLAKAGLIAMAIDLTSRAGGTAKGNVSSALGQLAPADAIADLTAGAQHLASLGAGKIGVTGFCYGGGMTLRSAANVPGLSAAVAYYGPAPDPVDQMKNANIPILAHYGASDARVNASIPALEANVGGTFTKHIHEGAGHGFNNDTGGGYNEAAATTAWPETLAWFTKYLA
jgi:carboxymethylenebutenolidase